MSQRKLTPAERSIGPLVEIILEATRVGMVNENIIRKTLMVAYQEGHMNGTLEAVKRDFQLRGGGSK